MIAGEILRRIHKRAAFDEIAIAELIRRMIDLAVTFKYPPAPFNPSPAQEAPQKFVVILPEPMLVEFNNEAHHRNQSPDELLRQVAIYYLIARHRVAAMPSRAA